MNLQDAVQFLNSMAENYERESELWQMEVLDEPGDREMSLEKSMACEKKSDAIHTVLDALNHQEVYHGDSTQQE